MRLASYLVFSAVAISCSLLARGAEVLDQSNDCTGCAAADTATPFSQEVGQTFTVGVAGTLSRIEAQINRIFGSGGSVILSVFGTTGGVPNATSLGSVSLSWELFSPTGFDYRSFDVSSFAIPVQVGEVLAFGIKSSGETGFGLRSTFNISTYAGGESKFRSLGPPPGAWSSYGVPHDNGFKTYVLAAPAGIPGDFNNDGSVTAADYVTWKKTDGSSSALPNDNGLGVPIGLSHYNLWRSNFGKPPGAGSSTDISAELVPEPGTLLLLIFCLGCCMLVRLPFEITTVGAARRLKQIAHLRDHVRTQAGPRAVRRHDQV